MIYVDSISAGISVFHSSASLLCSAWFNETDRIVIHTRFWISNAMYTLILNSCVFWNKTKTKAQHFFKIPQMELDIFPSAYLTQNVRSADWQMRMHCSAWDAYGIAKAEQIPEKVPKIVSRKVLQHIHESDRKLPERQRKLSWPEVKNKLRTDGWITKQQKRHLLLLFHLYLFYWNTTKERERERETTSNIQKKVTEWCIVTVPLEILITRCNLCLQDI